MSASPGPSRPTPWRKPPIAAATASPIAQPFAGKRRRSATVKSATMPSATSVPAALTIGTTSPTPSSPVTSVEDRDDVAGVHRVARRDAERGERPVARGDDLDLHLHRFHDEEGLVLLHAGARLRREAEHLPEHRRDDVLGHGSREVSGPGLASPSAWSSFACARSSCAPSSERRRDASRPASSGAARAGRLSPLPSP